MIYKMNISAKDVTIQIAILAQYENIIQLLQF